jgi:hypothetical protein
VIGRVMWATEKPGGEVFSLDSDWSACIIPLLFNKDRYTVSMFFKV